MCSLSEVGAPPEIEPGDLVDELGCVLEKKTRSEARATSLLGRLISAEAFRRDGYSSPTAMLKHRFSMTSSDAHQMVIRAKHIGETPLVELAYIRGAITSAQTDALIYAHQVAPEPFEQVEADMVELAMDTPSVRDLRKKLNYWLECVAEDDLAADRSLDRELRSLRVRRDGQMVRYSGWFEPETGEEFIAAIEPGPPIPGDNRPAHQRRADNLADILGGAAQRPSITVHVDLERLSGTTDEPTSQSHVAETSTGVFLTKEDVRRLACDSTVTRVVFGPASAPLDVGRQNRLVTPGMRRALEARDRECVFPGCDRPPHWCDAHHIEHWADGGPTSVENLTLLCRYHHTLIHDHGWQIRGKPADLRFYRPDGTEWTGRTLQTSSVSPVTEAPAQTSHRLMLDRFAEAQAEIQEMNRQFSDWSKDPPG